MVYDGADTRKQDAKTVTRSRLLGVSNSIPDRISGILIVLVMESVLLWCSNMTVNDAVLLIYRHNPSARPT